MTVDTRLLWTRSAGVVTVEYAPLGLRHLRGLFVGWALLLVSAALAFALERARYAAQPLHESATCARDQRRVQMLLTSDTLVTEARLRDAAMLLRAIGFDAHVDFADDIHTPNASMQLAD